MTPPRHVPVLAAQVLHFLDPQPGQTIVDCTLGAGGHARLIAQRLTPGGRLVGLDQDPAMLDIARLQLAGIAEVDLQSVQASFDQLRPVLDRLGIDRVDSILADLGVCSDQLDDPARGLSFQEEGPLDMRLDRGAGEPAGNVLKRLNERELADIFWRYGEERYSRRVARRIVQTRQETPLETTTQLAALIRSCVPRGRRGPGSIDPATRVFQALRIAVNDELGALERFLKGLPHCLRPGRPAVVISFHSLEDRLVKRTFRDRQTWTELTRKPIQAEEDEIRTNPRARSAKLRAAILQSEPGT
jgi:16S rRNA (cytosine1402-N4)-methyltransferase